MFAPKAETAAAKEPQAGSSLVANWRIPVEDAGLRRILPFQPGALAPAVFLLSRLHLLLHLTPHQRSSLHDTTTAAETGLAHNGSSYSNQQKQGRQKQQQKPSLKTRMWRLKRRKLEDPPPMHAHQQ